MLFNLNLKDINYNNAVQSSTGVLFKYEWVIYIRFICATFAMLSMALLRSLGLMDFPPYAFLVPHFVEMFVNQPYPFLVRKAKNPDTVVFVNSMIDMFVITWALHTIGGMNAFFWVLVYPLVFISTGFLIGMKNTFYLANVAFLCYAGLVYLESNGSLPVLGMHEVYLPDKARLVNTLLVFPFYNLLAYASSFLGGMMHQREEQLRETKNMLYQAGKLAARSGTTMAHKINPPLSKIKGQLLFLEEKFGAGSPSTAMLKTIAHQVSDIEGIINGAITKDVNAGGVLTPVDIHQHIEEAFSIASAQLRDGRVKVKRQYGENIPHLKADAKQMEQLFVNIIGNIAEGASKHGGGELLAKTRKVEAGVDRPQDTLEVVFASEVPSEAEIRLAQQFTSDNPPAEAGVGILTCLAIVQRHGGKMRMQYTQGQDVKYLISLPINEDLS